MKKKTERFEIRLTPEQKDRLLTLANFYNKTMAEIVIDLIGCAYVDCLLGSANSLDALYTPFSDDSPDPKSNVYIY